MFQILRTLSSPDTSATFPRVVFAKLPTIYNCRIFAPFRSTHCNSKKVLNFFVLLTMLSLFKPIRLLPTPDARTDPPIDCKHQLASLNMEEELRCCLCRRFLEDPILLSCGHSNCRSCVLKVGLMCYRSILLTQLRNESSTVSPSSPSSSLFSVIP